jgi:cellobiose phosphorylase
MYRIWVEEVLGLQVRGDRLSVNPAIPDEWPGFEIVYRYRSTTYEITVRRMAGQPTIALDGALLIDSFVLLRDDGSTHQVTISISQPQTAGKAQPPVPLKKGVPTLTRE